MNRRLTIGASLAAISLSLLGFDSAPAYVGASFLSLPGVAGGWPGPDHRNWLKVSAHYWKADEGGVLKTVRRRPRDRLYFSVPSAPEKGADQLMISVDKKSPALSRLMQMCASKAQLPEISFAESSTQARSLAEIGPRPPEIPEYFEYRLKKAQITDCPVVPGAPEQALVVSFSDIDWLNYKGGGRKLSPQPAALPRLRPEGETKTFVISWISPANDVSDKQCPKLNDHPSQDDYYALMSKDEAAQARAAHAKDGGVSFDNGDMERRGPHGLNAVLLPGIVKDPGLIAPQSSVARGLNLDGDDGHGRPPPGVCKHKNYVSEDGRTGIDNQLFTVEGCIKGLQGHKGFYPQYTNEQRRNGGLSILLQISGIKNPKNDDHVDILILYSKDPMAKNAAGNHVLPDYTFRVSDKPEYTYYFTHVRGRIVNGVILSDPVDTLKMNLGIDPELTLHKAQFRLEIEPDGTLKGVLGGYQDWRRVMMSNAASQLEFDDGFAAPGLYNALKRNADGLKDPRTGECEGISVAFDVEGAPAFIPPAQTRTLMAQANTGQGAAH